MTCRYSEINQHDARYNLARAYPGGIEMLARRMGMSVNVLRNKLAPGIKTHVITDEEDSLIIEYCEEARVVDPCRALIAKNWRHRLIAFPLPDADHLSSSDLAQAMCHTVKEFADVMSTTSNALADGKVSVAEMDVMEKEMQEALAALCELRDRVRAAAQPAHQPISG